jgi:hypothetical protein
VADGAFPPLDRHNQHGGGGEDSVHGGWRGEDVEFAARAAAERVGVVHLRMWLARHRSI